MVTFVTVYNFSIEFLEFLKLDVLRKKIALADNHNNNKTMEVKYFKEHKVLKYGFEKVSLKMSSKS
jgi:hypothetical protein